MPEYKVNYTQSNFTGGIIAAELYGRNDFNKVKAGMKKCENWTLREAGGLEFRRGTKYICDIPAGAGTNFKMFSLNDVLILLCASNFYYLLNGSTSWVSGSYPSGFVPAMSTLNAIELKQRLYVFDGTANKLVQIKLVQSGANLIPSAEFCLFEGALPAGSSISASTQGTAPTPNVMIKYQYAFSISKDADHESVYLMSNEATANSELGEGDASSQRIDLTITVPSSIANDPDVAKWKINIYKKYQGKFLFLNSFFMTSGRTSYTPSTNSELSDKGVLTVDMAVAGKQTPTYMNSDGSIQYVNSVGDYGQRLFMTQLQDPTQGSKIQRLLFSQVGNTDSMVYSELRNSDEAGYLELPISNFDSWVRIFSGLDLIMSTSYTISQVQGNGDLTSQTILFDGFSKTVNPVAIQRSVIYTNTNNRNIYDLAYNEYGQYDSVDLTLLVKYIFERKTIKRVAFKDYPVKTIYVLCDDGELYGLTYIKQQNIYGWYKIKTYAAYKDILVVNRETEDRVFCIVNDNGTLRLDEFYFRTDDVYMDSVIRRNLNTITNNVITGLSRFEGKKVRVFDLNNNLYYGEYDIQNPQTVVEGGNVVEIDEVAFNGFTVQNGQITLPSTVELTGDVLVGLPYFAVMESIPLEFQDTNGNSTIGRQKTINDAYLRYGDSRGLTYKTMNKEYDCGIAKKDIADNAQFLERGQVKLDTNSEFRWDSTIKILQRQPYPARLESLTLGITFNDKS